MLNTEIDFAAALRILVAIVKDFGPDHRATNPDGSTGCTYFVFDTDKYGSSYIDVTNLRAVCIVGQAFQRLGIARALLRTESEQYAVCGITEGLWDNAAVMGVNFTEDARRLFRNAQERQDNGLTWAQAIPEAVERTQDDVLAAFKEKNAAFSYSTQDALREIPEALAEWEKELLAGK